MYDNKFILITVKYLNNTNTIPSRVPFGSQNLTGLRGSSGRLIDNLISRGILLRGASKEWCARLKSSKEREGNFALEKSQLHLNINISINNFQRCLNDVDEKKNSGSET